MNTKGKVLLTGASGFVGHHATKRLLNEGYEVVLFLKTSDDQKFFRDLGIENIYAGDLSYGCPELKQAFAEHQFDSIVHLAALIKAPWSEFQQVNVDGTKFIAELAEAQSTVKHFVFTSTDFVLFDAANEYKESKRLSEVMLRATKILPYTILRPSPIYGSGDDKNLMSLLKIIKKMPVLPAPTFLMYPVYVGDVVDAIVKVLQSSNVIRKEYNIPGAPVMTFREMLREMRDALGKPCLLVPVPNWFFAFAVKMQEKMLKTPVLNYYQVEKWGMNKPISAEDAIRDFGWKQTPFREGIRETVKELGWNKIQQRRRGIIVAWATFLTAIGTIVLAFLTWQMRKDDLNPLISLDDVEYVVQDSQGNILREISWRDGEKTEPKFVKDLTTMKLLIKLGNRGKKSEIAILEKAETSIGNWNPTPEYKQTLVPGNGETGWIVPLPIPVTQFLNEKAKDFRINYQFKLENSKKQLLIGIICILNQVNDSKEIFPECRPEFIK